MAAADVLFEAAIYLYVRSVVESAHNTSWHYEELFFKKRQIYVETSKQPTLFTLIFQQSKV